MSDWTFVEKMALLQTILLSVILIGVFRSTIKRIINGTKVFVRRFIGVCIYHVARLIPRDPKFVVFGAEAGQGFRGNTKYLYLKAKQDDRIHCVWVLKNPIAVKQMNQEGMECYSVHSLKGIYFQLRAKTFIHSHSIHDDFNRYLLGGATSINTWHGVGLKKVWGANQKTYTYKALHEKNPIKRWLHSFVVRTQNASISYVISTSDVVSSYYPETYLVKKENILQLGQARNDVFFHETEEDEAVPSFIKENRVITYMPTHRNFGKLDKDINRVLDLKELDAFCEAHGYKFLVKRHMFSKGQVPTRLKNVVDISHENIDPQMLLKYTDILVTDFSSCYTDYLLLNRPVLFYCYDLDEYLTKSNEMYHDYYDVTPGPKVESFASFMEALEDVVNGRDSYDEERKEVLDIFYEKKNQKTVTDQQVAYIFEHILKLEYKKTASVSSSSKKDHHHFTA
ncbi:CDP-glycerol glycerophosphotransferase family protein [Marininema mesophilum]|uniref:CDP-glycerol glycerophosphotransferase family protein n=1 Tax=Marininema mesophilum TaxID=1048340 RepID=UPI000B82B17B|nr:CDP-glycerol glycerophosphotransferase family protein [Marininema mesophilum]